jgi:hypothetical protein
MKFSLLPYMKCKSAVQHKIDHKSMPLIHYSLFLDSDLERRKLETYWLIVFAADVDLF